jgi:isoquinoline 1-oxidoreductase subunit beta
VPVPRPGVMLIQAAAAQWNIDPASCRAKKGEVVSPTGETINYGALVDAAAKLPVPHKVAIKDPKDFTLIGTLVKRLDTPEKVNGKAKFGIDAMIPGMKFATVAACPVFGGKLKSVDDSKAMAIKGVQQVVKIDNAVTAVGDHMWAAMQGLAALDIEWDDGPNVNVSTESIVEQMARASQNEGVVARSDGDVAKAIPGAKKVDAIYEMPFLAHATMEPMNCTVHVTEDSCDIWVGIQVVSRAQATASAHGRKHNCDP